MEKIVYTREYLEANPILVDVKDTEEHDKLKELGLSYFKTDLNPFISRPNSYEGGYSYYIDKSYVGGYSATNWFRDDYLGQDTKHVSAQEVIDSHKKEEPEEEIKVGDKVVMVSFPEEEDWSRWARADRLEVGKEYIVNWIGRKCIRLKDLPENYSHETKHFKLVKPEESEVRFKVGDQVELQDTIDDMVEDFSAKRWINKDGLRKGEIYTITSVTPSGQFVNLDGKLFSHHKLSFKLVKTDKQMEKKVIAYELLKDTPTNKAGEIFKLVLGAINAYAHSSGTQYTTEQVKNTEWFKPIYEEEIKEGDKVVVLSLQDFRDHTGEKHYGYNNDASKTISIGDILSVREVTSSSFNFKKWVSFNENSADLSINQVRKATEEEIKKWKETLTVKISTYNSEIREEGEQKVVAFGCQSFTKNELETISRLLGGEIRASITIRKVNIDQTIISKLLRQLDNAQ